MTDQKSIVPQKDGFKQALGQVSNACPASLEGEDGKRSSGQEEVNWYAIRAFKRKVMKIKEDCL